MIDYVIFIGSLKKGGAEKNAALLANHLVDSDTRVTILCFSDEVAFDLDTRVKREVINIARFNNRILNICSTYFTLFKRVWSIRPKRLITMSRIAGLFAALTFYPKTIVRFDMYPLIGYKKYKVIQFFLFYNLPWVKFVVCPSQELLDDVKRYFIRKGKLKLIYNPIPQLDTSNANPHLGNKPYFLILGRLTGQKGVDDIIKAFSKSKVRNTVNLLIIGDGNRKDSLEKLVSTYDLNDSVHFLGFIKEPKPYIMGSIALISASFREGFPNVHLEALAYGTPVISSLAKTGPAEIIKHGVNGLLFEVGDIEKLKEWMEKMALDPEFYITVKANTDIDLKRFSKEKIMESWDKILK